MLISICVLHFDDLRLVGVDRILQDGESVELQNSSQISDIP